MAKHKFLSIYTPTYRRPTLLARCVASVDGQTARKAIQHLIIPDEVGIGIDGMFAAIADNTARLRGDYVYILQDDDVLAGPGVVEALRDFAQSHGRPEVVIIKNRKWGRTYPRIWQARPGLAQIDLGNYAVRRDIFTAHAGDFGRRYEGDFDFIDAIWRAGREFTWCDMLFAVATVEGLGRPETELMAR